METICMKCLILFSGEIRKISSICHLLNSAQRMVKVKYEQITF